MDFHQRFLITFGAYLHVQEDLVKDSTESSSMTPTMRTRTAAAARRHGRGGKKGLLGRDCGGHCSMPCYEQRYAGAKRKCDEEGCENWAPVGSQYGIKCVAHSAKMIETRPPIDLVYPPPPPRG